MSTITQHGYLLLADISGYTFYLAGVELEHAHEILADLLEVIIGKLRNPMTISKLEGDAVFSYASDIKFPRGEILLELLESTYAAFRNRISASDRHTTCDCRACQGMTSLDLKFIVHHGEYILQDVMDFHEVIGSDVNLAHRLLKNHVSAETGWRAYALMTGQCFQHLGLDPAAWHAQVETYEHLGDTRTFSYDLQSRYLRELEIRQVVVAPPDAMVVISQEMPASVEVVWDWLNDPHKRTILNGKQGIVYKFVLLPNGRPGVGAITHCIHGDQLDMEETVLDWHPFEYYTVEQAAGGRMGKVVATFCLEALSTDQTRLTLSIKGRVLPGFLNPLAVRLIYGNIFYKPLMAKLAKLLLEPAPVSAADSPSA